MRVFIGLGIAPEVRTRIAETVDRVRALAPDARWVRAESLHVTLKFIGEAPESRVLEVQETLKQIKTPAFEIEFKDAGFFPGPKAARVFWIGIHAPEALQQLAATIDQKLEKFGIAREEGPYRPHLTLARAAPGKPGRCFQILQQHLGQVGDMRFGTMNAREFFLYRSELLRGGAQYTQIQGFPLESL